MKLAYPFIGGSAHKMFLVVEEKADRYSHQRPPEVRKASTGGANGSVHYAPEEYHKLTYKVGDQALSVFVLDGQQELLDAFAGTQTTGAYHGECSYCQTQVIVPVGEFKPGDYLDARRAMSKVAGIPCPVCYAPIRLNADPNNSKLVLEGFDHAPNFNGPWIRPLPQA